MKNFFNFSLFKMLTCFFAVAMFCFMSSALADTEVEPGMKQQWRKNYEWHKRRGAKKRGKKVTDEELEKGWPAYLEVKMKRLEKMIASYESENTDLYMKGKVVDQDGIPVPNTKLEFEVRKNSGRKEVYSKVVAVTDKSGAFTIKKKKGVYIRLVDIVPPSGYKYLPEHQVGATFWPVPDNRMFSDASLAVGLDYYDPAPQSHKSRYYYHSQKHVVPFRLWKRVHVKQERIFQDQFHGKIYIDGDWYMMNFFRLEGHNDFSKVPDPNTDIDGDILFKADFSEDKKNIILTISPVDGGIIENPDNSLNAPESGYMPMKTYELTASERGELKAMVFMKSRGDRVYSRVRLWVTKSMRPEEGESIVYISGKFFANPQGSRNIEPWGPRHGNKIKLADRDWKRKDFDDFKDRLQGNQAEQMAQLESSYMCQIEDGGLYYKGYLGSNKTFYKYIGTGSNQMHESIPLVAKPRYTVDIEPQKTFTYIRGLLKGKGNGYYGGFVFEERKLVLYFSGVRFSERKKRSNYLPIPIVYSKKLTHDKYEVVEMVKPVAAQFN